MGGEIHDGEQLARPTYATPGALAIVLERARQIHGEGFDDAHDDDEIGSLLTAGLGYLQTARLQMRKTPPVTWRAEPIDWPWDSRWWKPSEDPIRNLEKAGALIAAEIDRELRSRDKALAEGVGTTD